MTMTDEANERAVAELEAAIIDTVGSSLTGTALLALVRVAAQIIGKGATGDRSFFERTLSITKAVIDERARLHFGCGGTS